jgi:blocked-early-in-transport protein 1
MKMRQPSSNAARSALFRRADGGSGSAASSNQMNRRPNGRDEADVESAFAEETMSLMERENAQRMEELGQKASVLNSLAKEIQSEVDEQNRFLDEMQQRFGTVGAQLANSMIRIKDLAKTASSRHMCYLIMFVLVVFFILYTWMRSGKSRA